MKYGNDKIEYEGNKDDFMKLKQLMREFHIYLEGYSKNDSTVLNRLRSLYLEFEKFIFGEKITHSWS